ATSALSAARSRRREIDDTARSGVLADLAVECGGFEGNAQTLRLLTRLESKTFDQQGRSVGLNLTRATLDACSKYPWGAEESRDGKFGVYADDRPVFSWMRAGVPAAEPPRRCLEAQVMDLADDVAYSVHDVEDGVVADRVDLTRLDSEAVWATLREWYPSDLAEVTDDELEDVLADLRAVGSWPHAPYDGSRASLAALKNLTSDLIGRFCGAVQHATHAAGPGPFVRYEADLVVPRRTGLEMLVLKGVAAHYVMQAEDRLAVMARQRELLGELVALLAHRGPDALDRAFADDWHGATDDAGRLRVVVDQVASLTDASAVSRWEALRAPRVASRA
ncbi:MAG: deoxyguanosinetriphosphate triphosphohydrolase, partial [Nocardioides sp.]